MGKAKKKITKWAGYNKALCKRGSVTFWIDDSAVDAWRCKTHHGKR
ncbi:IS5/IS1182 family transposase, partial [Vibrio sp. Vb2880]|nr:IS5/IS1182 family transposase [Vibrio sp. Vb2880]